MALEQFWIQKSFCKEFNIKMGHIIVPVGGTNQHHMPTEFFGVYRPEGENTIMPCTWHETGISLWGQAGKWRYEAMLLPGLDSDRFNLFSKGDSRLPKYPNQKIWPYSDMIQHKLYMVNDIRTGWCRTTPLWGRGLHQRCTGSPTADRLHGNEKSDAYYTVQKFRELSKEDRDAIVKFIDSI